MKNCPYCGESIQDVAKKCRFCGEWLETKQCPICGETISARAKTCNMCGEDLEAIEPEIVEPQKGGKKGGKGGHKISNNVKEQQTEKGQSSGSKFMKVIEDNLVLIIFLIAIIFGLSQCSQKNNKGTDLEFQNNEITEQFTINKDDSTQLFKLAENSKNDGSVIVDNELKLVPTTGGYTLSNNFYSCFVSAENIDNFVESVNRGGKVRYCEPMYNSDEESNIDIIIDNTYSEDEDGKVDKSQPDKRINSLQTLLGNYEGKNLNIGLGFLYTTRKAPELPEEIHNERFVLKTNRAGFTSDKVSNISVKTNSNSKFAYYPNRRNLYYKDVRFTISEDDTINCKSKTENNDVYECYSSADIYKQIKKIYNDLNKGSDKHSGNALLEFFHGDDAFLNGDELYIYTDGQFELTDNEKDLKKTINRYATKGYLISNFNMNSYSKNLDKFKNAWGTNVAKKLGGINCNSTNIHFVGLTKQNLDFYNYAKEFFKDYMFKEGCFVDFKDINSSI